MCFAVRARVLLVASQTRVNRLVMHIFKLPIANVVVSLSAESPRVCVSGSGRHQRACDACVNVRSSV